MPRVAASRPVHPADRAIQEGDRSAPDAAAVLGAFAAYATGDDAAARAALQPVGLQSPYLQWKLLVRGLLAHSAGDDARAADNWRRLDPARLPARLAAPVWAMLDPDRATPTAARQARKLTGGPLADRLAKLPKLAGRGRSLRAALDEAAAVLPPLRTHAPHLVPRLARAFYRALREHGEKADLPRLAAVFGPPADDPEFHKLEALAYEDSRRPLDAVPHWLAYERWLASGPPGWPPAVRDRARAIVLDRAANLCRRADAPELWRRACDLAPDLPDPARALYQHHVHAKRPAEAEAVARRLLEHRPDHLPTLDALAELFDRENRPLELLAVRRQVLALNPLAAGVRAAATSAVVRAARSQVAAGDVPAAARTLAAHHDLGDAHAPAGLFVLRAVVALKLNQPADAAADLERAAADPADRAAVALLAAVDAGLAKLKPADRRRFTSALADALAGPVSPGEVLRLATAFDQLKADRVSYRGQVGHGRQIETLLLTAAAGPGEPAEFEAFGLGLARRKLWKPAAKVAPLLRKRFPASPVFPLLEVEAAVGKDDGRGVPVRLAGTLREARRLAEASRELRHRALLDRIAELERRAGPFDLFRTLFDEG